VGNSDFILDGIIDGHTDGKVEGMDVITLGLAVGIIDGKVDGWDDNVFVGAADGDSLGETVGTAVIVGDNESNMVGRTVGVSRGSKIVGPMVVDVVLDDDLSDLLLPDFEDDDVLSNLPDFALELSRFLDCRMAPLLYFLYRSGLSRGGCFRSVIMLESSMYC